MVRRWRRFHAAFTFECEGALPETILADAVRLRQTIMNLTSNAIKFTDRGGVRIIAKMRNELQEPQLHVELELEELAQLGDRIRLTPADHAEAETAGEMPPAPASNSKNDCFVPPSVKGSRHAQLPETPRSARQRSPVVSSLPTDDADFREIVEHFVRRLDENLEAIQHAWAAEDFDELAQLAHWLKGSGGTAGFDHFTTLARKLERLSAQRDQAGTAAIVDKLRDLAADIEMPWATAAQC